MAARAEEWSEKRRLEELLRCPVCSGSIIIEGDEAVCADENRRFPIADGVVVMVDDELLASDAQYDHQLRFFDAEFARYQRYQPENWRVSYLDRLRAAKAIDRAAAPLVDVGVGGSGHTVIEAARAGQFAVGCDLSLEGLRKARRFAETEGVSERTLWVCCSAERLPLASSSFSSVLAVAVIEHVPDDLAALREAARVLRPGGRIWITVPHALNRITPIYRPLNRLHDRRLGHLRRYGVEELVEAGRSVGLRALEVQFTGHPIKVAQLVAAKALRGKRRDRFWWWCERRDLHRSDSRRGSMQLSVLFTRAQ